VGVKLPKALRGCYHVEQGFKRMRIEAEKKLFTVDDYYRMAETGIIGPEERVELIQGEIVKMSPIGDRHAACVIRANRLFTGLLQGKATIGSHTPAQLTDYSEPEPDLVILKLRADDYFAKKVHAEDVLLLVEVSDSTLRYDRDTKVPLYAAAGIPEVWVEDLTGNELLVFREPAGTAYRTCVVLRPGDSISPLAFPEVRLQVAELIGL
jgi:Uma2 family endonuclease